MFFLSRSQEERGERHKVKKQIADVAAVTGDPTPFLPGIGSMCIHAMSNMTIASLVDF